MEAYRFGFDLPAANKFDPTEADIVARYLLPRAVGFPNPHGHAVIDADPCSCPPWELMRRHGHAGSDHAFFGRPRSQDRKRIVRAVGPGEDGVGGTWDGQKSGATRLVLSRAGGGAAAPRLEVTYKRHNLGWVMHDYRIVDPPHLADTVLYRVRITDRRKKEQGKQQQQADADAVAGHQVVIPPGPDQPGPSNYCEVEEHGGAVGDTGGYYADDDGSQYLNQDLSCYMLYDGDGSGDGDYLFNVGDDNSFQCPDGGNGG
ncbi:hypothetical protein PVAP13_8KG081000 [Panicum virgatum]|uniref:NAC domain-containing protein n=1 Tax=Panicum virgatum TaxID=38727 RepID=A0A8T0PI90_PANVG|nr:hypothetical protein PVAP13_8KG081000 [Panicum virgatum]